MRFSGYTSTATLSVPLFQKVCQLISVFRMYCHLQRALLVPAGTGNNFVLRFEAYAKNGKSIKEALGNIPDVDVALFADCRGRRELYTLKEYFTLTADEMRKLVK